MKTFNVEVEGSELILKNKAGDYVVIPKKHRLEVQDMIKERCYSCIDKLVETLPIMSEYAQDGTVVSNLWKERTGTEWTEAKKQGLTSGSYVDNIKLRARLMKGEFDKTPAQTIPNASSEKMVLDKFSTFAEAFRYARAKLGPNNIFEYNGRKIGTNLEGENFKPSQEVLARYKINTVATEERLVEQNKRMASPVTSKNVVKLEPEWKDWNEKREDVRDYNKMDQTDVIINFKNQHKTGKRYAIVDKKKALIHIYKEGSSQPLYTAGIDLGKTKSDAQTVTKYFDFNQDGRITEKDKLMGNKFTVDWSAGNMSTGAGKFYISNIDKKGWEEEPLLNMMSEAGYQEYQKTGKVKNIATSFHAGYIRDDKTRVSNGCIRCSSTTLTNLSRNLENMSEVYILPEDEGNKFVYENDQLNFRAGSKEDYEQYIDVKGRVQRGQGINRTKNTLKYNPIKITTPEDNNQIDNMFAEAIVKGKKKLMNELQITGDDYNDIAKLALGILGQESNFGQSAKYFLKDSFPSLVDILKWAGGNDSVNSQGLTQIKFGAMNEDVRNRLSLYGINGNDLSNPKKSAIATIVVLAHIYNSELKGTKLLENSGINWRDGLLYLYQGKKHELLNRTATPEKNGYIRNVKSFANRFSLEEYG